MFSDTNPGGEDIFHADYISGWDVNFLQRYLDDCDAEVEEDNCSAAPFTRREGVTYTGIEGQDDFFRSELARIRVPVLNTSCITTEAIDGITNLPRGLDCSSITST